MTQFRRVSKTQLLMINNRMLVMICILIWKLNSPNTDKRDLSVRTVVGKIFSCVRMSLCQRYRKATNWLHQLALVMFQSCRCLSVKHQVFSKSMLITNSSSKLRHITRRDTLRERGVTITRRLNYIVKLLKFIPSISRLYSIEDLPMTS